MTMSAGATNVEPPSGRVIATCGGWFGGGGGLSLSAIVTVALAGAPTVYDPPGATPRTTVSAASTAASSTGVTATGAEDDPAGIVTDVPRAAKSAPLDAVPPTVTVTLSGD